MKKMIGFLFLVISISSLVTFLYFRFNLAFWLKPPHEKLHSIWSEDIAKLQNSKSLPKEWAEVAEIQVKSDNSPLHEWLPKIKPPISTNSKGRYRLEIFFVLLLEGNRYGTVVEYNLFEIKTANKIWELGRTYKLGIMY